eukprot:TRINITY_DN3047_c0_g1_i5.p1 TRINITY_DN3047_c0_g1~~TRINITY_DN3047_c0_g1_i5.p1  ORF type:complete len:376 (-),score=117.00 TRINITY_DN3047_c0_g1_i5:440-1567(-)
MSFSIGDPALYGMHPNSDILEAVQDETKSVAHHGYPPAVGYEFARKAVAEKYSQGEASYKSDDVVLTSGCSLALDLAIQTLADPGENILVPTPGFSIYVTSCAHHGIEPRCYKLLSEQGWEMDLAQCESLIDDKTRGILVNNPSNPCGSVWTEAHMRDILALAARHNLPIISDEVYADIVFPSTVAAGIRFISFASISTNVPILTTSSMSKQGLVPGWRLGWLLLHDPTHVMEQIRVGLVQIAQMIFGPNSMAQAALPRLMQLMTPEYMASLAGTLQRQADVLIHQLRTIPQLTFVEPQGAMYVMVGLKLAEFRDIESDIDFCQKLLAEQSVAALPGSCFRQPNFIRLVFCVAEDVLVEAGQRIAQFCADHSVQA